MELKLKPIDPLPGLKARVEQYFKGLLAEIPDEGTRALAKAYLGTEMQFFFMQPGTPTDEEVAQAVELWGNKLVFYSKRVAEYSPNNKARSGWLDRVLNRKR